MTSLYEVKTTYEVVDTLGSVAPDKNKLLFILQVGDEPAEVAQNSELVKKAIKDGRPITFLTKVGRHCSYKEHIWGI